ncbi:hypothetical protein, partial [Burkholderia sp. Ac-20384]|uniref:hypothetical protein n=1 Tax=Burkholderia sp. Ac-20384 TaxID=2703902 RepID=UPI00197EEDDE
GWRQGGRWESGEEETELCGGGGAGGVEVRGVWVGCRGERERMRRIGNKWVMERWERRWEV